MVILKFQLSAAFTLCETEILNAGNSKQRDVCAKIIKVANRRVSPFGDLSWNRLCAFSLFWFWLFIPKMLPFISRKKISLIWIPELMLRIFVKNKEEVMCAKVILVKLPSSCRRVVATTTIRMIGSHFRHRWLGAWWRTGGAARWRSAGTWTSIPGG